MQPPISETDCDYLTTAGRELVPALRDARIFITGGTGIIGSWLLEALFSLNMGYGLGLSVTVLTRDPAAFASRRPHLADGDMVTFETGDVRSFSGSSGDHAYILHAAVDSVPRYGSRLELSDTIVEGTRRILDYAARTKPDGLLFVSSNAVYGRAPGGPALIEESCGSGPLVTDTDIEYDESKRMAEALCVLYSREFGVNAKIARCFPIVGPYLPLDNHFAIGNFIRDGMNGGPIIVRGDGTAVRSYLYLADLAIWLLTILVKGAPAHPYNVGSEEAVTMRALAHRIAAFFDPPCRVTVEGTPPVTGAPVSRFVPSTGRARMELGCCAGYSLEHSLGATINYYAKLIPPGHKSGGTMSSHTSKETRKSI